MTRRWRRPGVLAIALTLLGAGAFSGLGLWQLGRAEQKQRLLDAFAEATHAPVADFSQVRDAVDMQHYPHVRVAGRYVGGRGYLLDEQMRGGRAGVHAIGVFAVAGDARLLLVDRGWIAWDHAPGTLPPLPPLPGDETAVSGIYAPYPGGGLRLGGNALPAQTSWPKLTLHLDAAPLAADLGAALLPGVLLLDDEPGSGFVREWTPQVMPPERHRAYAFQWFMLAVAAVTIFIVLHWRNPETEQ